MASGGRRKIRGGQSPICLRPSASGGGVANSGGGSSPICFASRGCRRSVMRLLVFFFYFSAASRLLERMSALRDSTFGRISGLSELRVREDEFRSSVIRLSVVSFHFFAASHSSKRMPALSFGLGARLSAVRWEDSIFEPFIICASP